MHKKNEQAQGLFSLYMELEPSFSRAKIKRYNFPQFLALMLNAGKLMMFENVNRDRNKKRNEKNCFAPSFHISGKNIYDGIQL